MSPKYIYTGGNPYLEVISDYFTAERREKETGAVYIPVPVILKIEENKDETLVYGCFWDFWYEKEEKSLFCINYSENTGRLHLKRRENAYEVTDFERVRDGEDFTEDLEERAIRILAGSR